MDRHKIESLDAMAPHIRERVLSIRARDEARQMTSRELDALISLISFVVECDPLAQPLIIDWLLHGRKLRVSPCRKLGISYRRAQHLIRESQIEKFVEMWGGALR